MVKKVLPFLVLILIAALLLNGCRKETECEGGKTGTVRNYGGIDGCWVLIEVDNTGDLLEPLNRNEFGIDFIDGQRLQFLFIDEPTVTNCLIGRPVELTCVKPL